MVAIPLSKSMAKPKAARKFRATSNRLCSMSIALGNCARLVECAFSGVEMICLQCVAWAHNFPSVTPG
jgi:hypothetical protein